MLTLLEVPRSFGLGVAGADQVSGLVVRERLGVDASTMEANAVAGLIVRRDTGETYQQLLERIATDNGAKTPTLEKFPRMDRKRKSKTSQNDFDRDESVARSDKLK